jgi:hypothetical protein
MDNSSFVSGAVVLSGGLEVTGGGQMQIASNGITTARIADFNVTTAKISDGAITPIKLANSDFGDFTVSSGVATIDNDAITTVKIADSTSTTTGVTTSKIADSNITAPKLSGTQTGTAPIFGIRAWVTFDMARNSSGGSDTANTNRFIYSSGNVASVQKIDTGRFQINFTTAMPNSNYAYFGSARTLSGDNSGDVTIGRPNSTGNADGAKTTSSIRLDVVDAGASFFNSPEVCVAIIG